MGYFQVRYDSRVVNYDYRGFIKLATGCKEMFNREVVVVQLVKRTPEDRSSNPVFCEILFIFSTSTENKEKGPGIAHFN